MARSPRIRAGLLWLLLCGLPSGASALPGVFGLPPRERFVPGHLAVRLRAGATLPSLPGLQVLRAFDSEARTLLLGVGDGAEVATLRALSSHPAVEWVEREHLRQVSGAVTANDPFFPKQWSLAMVHLPEAWSRSEGSVAVTVAVLDSGIRPHPDLEPRYLPGFDFVTNQDNAGDGDGRDPDPADPGGPDEGSSGLHGLHVTGILAAHTDNGVGIAGVDWRCQILPVRVLGVQRGTGTDADIADGLRWAAGLPVPGMPQNPNPARVINLSFGGPGGSLLIQSAVNDAVAAAAIVVAAAGNDAADTAGYAPAGLDHVIAVGAVDGQGKLAPYSNRGPRVDLVAPGGDLGAMVPSGILSTLWSQAEGYTYVELNGTSQAAPHVAGVAALMKAIDPTLRADAARTILTATADPSRQCADGCGGGLLDADAALAAVQVGCADGHCVRARIGVDVYEGCALEAGTRRGRGPGALVLVAAALLALAWRPPRPLNSRRRGATFRA